MLVALSDTHADGPPSLSDHLRDQLSAADVVAHAGDFTVLASLEAFEQVATQLVAVHGNADSEAVRARLPATATFAAFSRQFLVVHGDGYDETRLSLLARQSEADVVVTGHTHRPGIGAIDDVTVLNPGSHADPRGARPAYATVGQASGGVVARLHSPAGECFEQSLL